MTEPSRATPRALLAVSVGAPEFAVVPVLAALEAGGVEVRAIDVGRVGLRSHSTASRVVRAVASELGERRLARELSSNPPDVVLAFDPGTTQLLTAARDTATKPAAVLAVVAELSPDPEWALTDADRYACVDDEAAVALATAGVPEDRILTAGAMCAAAFCEAGARSRAAQRKRFSLPANERIVLVRVAGEGGGGASQLALQLSLSSAPALYLFDAGDDVDAATTLRRQVPTLDLRAKLFGKTKDAAALWRAADVVCAKPTARHAMWAMATGASMVALAAAGDSEDQVGQALAARGLGAVAETPLALAATLEPLLGRGAQPGTVEGLDGAANVAAMAWIMGSDRRAIAEERRVLRSQQKQRTERAAAEAPVGDDPGPPKRRRDDAVAGDLEDLSGPARTRATSAGAGASSAPRAAAQKPPEKSIDDLLAELKRGQKSGPGPSSSTAAAKNEVDDELAALKRKMADKGRRR